MIERKVESHKDIVVGDLIDVDHISFDYIKEDIEITAIIEMVDKYGE